MNGTTNGREAARLTDVYCFDNGQVMAFDQNGQQMPQFQGARSEVWERIEAAFARDPRIVIKGASKPLTFKEGLNEQA